jgi:hypothetical protein
MASKWTDPDLGKKPEQLFAERAKRVADATAMKQPDRIPVNAPFGYGLADWSGVTRQELLTNPAKQLEVLTKYALEFQPDLAMGLWGGPGPSAALGDQMTKWPSYGLDENGSFQFNEQEFMKAEDYEDFLFDTSDWVLRKYIPRAFSNLKAFADLPPFGMYAFGYYTIGNLMNFATPGMAEALQAIGKAIQLSGESMAAGMASMQKMAELGFPPAMFMAGALIEAPFDFMSDTLRGMRGIMLDLHKRQDQLLEAQEKVLKIQLDFAIQQANKTGMRVAGIPLHRGSDGFMSLPAFERFYWPQLKAMIEGLAANDISSFVFFEGVWDERLEYLATLPKGRVVGAFQSSDIFKVKEVLGDTMCIMGGMKNSLLSGSSVEEVRDWTKKVCQKVGKGGGYIMCPGVMELEGTDPRLVKAWIDATKEFGQY